MKSTGRIHRFTPSLWIGILFYGSSCILAAIGTVVADFDDLIVGNMAPFDYAAFFLVVPFSLCSGVFLLVVLAITKIATSPQGLEYHALFYIVKIDWQEVKMLPRDKAEMVRRSVSQAESQASEFPQIAPRRWTGFVGLDAKKQAIKNGVPLHRFGGYRGRQLMADIRRYAPHLGI